MKTNTGSTVGIALSVALALSVLALASTAFADSKSGTGVEVNIGGNGNVLVRGAEVTAVSDTEVKADTSLGSSVLSWIVKTDSDTDFVAVKGASEGVANIEVGDTISFRGTIDQAVAGLTVNAKQVKDWTAVETKARIDGVISSINATLGSFTIAKGGATTTVQTSSSTKFKVNGENGTFADLFLNAKVKIMGMFNASSSVVTATSVDVSSSTKHKWDKDDAKEWRNWIKSKVWLHLGR